MLDSDQLWMAIVALAQKAQAGDAVEDMGPLGNGALGDISVDPAAPRGWSSDVPLAAELQYLLDLYVPLCIGAQANDLVVAHLGQSLDGRIATHSGASQFITGAENLLHTHRMRTLLGTVLIGAQTAIHDNPRLTTRLAEGDNAVRVLIDPQCTTDTRSNLFTDGNAKTIVLCDENCVPSGDAGGTRYIGLPYHNSRMACSDILAALRGVGLRRVFIEGGGQTVSHFLQHRALHRLQVCVAPMIIGSGRPAFTLPQIDELKESQFFTAQHFRCGSDILFDCQVRE